MRNVKKIRKSMAVVCATAMMATMLVGCGSKENSVENSKAKDAQKDMQTLESSLVNHSAEAGKTETVYVMMDADGNVNNTVVSEWLHNPDGSETMSDMTNLSDIEVVKGDATYTTDGENIEWNTAGGDIFYQGSTDEELPVSVSVSYELDGKPVSAEALEGAKGHLVMTFNYTNNTAKEVTTAQGTYTIYQPFAMISGVIFDCEKVSDVTVDGGSAVNDGERVIVYGTAFPGLYESLGVEEYLEDDNDISFPDKVVIEAEVEDFSAPITMTVATNSALNQLKLDELGTTDELDVYMSALTEGMDALVEGAAQLDEGANALSDGLMELQGNVPTLTTGVAALLTGAKDLSDGSATLAAYNEGIKEGLTAIANGSSTLYTMLTAEETKQSMDTLIQGLIDFGTNLKALEEGIAAANAGLNQIMEGYSYADGTELAALLAGLEQMAQVMETNAQNAFDAQQIDLDTYRAQLTQAGYIRTLITTYKGLYDNVGTVSTGLNTASAGLTALSTSYENTLKPGVDSIIEKLSDIATAVGQINTGISTLNTSLISYLDGVAALATGSKSLYGGMVSLNGSIPALATGVTQLVEGASTLATGTGSLNDGIIRYNEDGIEVISDLLTENLEVTADRIQEIAKYAQSYGAFGGALPDEDCQVVFIFKTE